MKKVLSLFMALVMLVSVLGAGTSAYAADAKTVDAQIKGAANYLLENADNFTVDSSADFLMIIRSGVNVSKYKDGYANSVKANLQANSGKLIFTKYNYDYETNSYVADNVEDFGLTAAAILCLKALGYNPASFGGYNLSSYFAKMDLNASKPNPYHYRLAVEAADSTRAKAIISSYISDYYVMGSGMSYWGYSCDNTSNFLTAIAPYKNNYKAYVDDAKKVIQTYTKSNGAYCDDVYSTEVNADSTATALMAYASLGELSTAEKYYNWLVKGFSGSKTGVFTAYGSDNAYATKDALLALEYYKKALDADAAAKSAAIKQQTNAFKAQKTNLTKLTAGKKRMRVVYKKLSNASGYEVMYSTTKNFTKKTTKTVNIGYTKAGTYTFKGLKAKKKYYFRVRAYKVIGGKKVYTSWSAVKSKKTK